MGRSLPVALEVLGGGERAPMTLQVGKDAVAALLADRLQRFLEFTLRTPSSVLQSPTRALHSSQAGQNVKRVCAKLGSQYACQVRRMCDFRRSALEGIPGASSAHFTKLRYDASASISSSDSLLAMPGMGTAAVA